MKKSSSIFLAMLLSVSIPLSACSKKDTDDSVGAVAVQSTYNTLKVMQTAEFPALGQRLDVCMAKGETEGGQLIVTPEKDVKSVSLSVSDLRLKTDESVVFSKENIQVYFQKYLHITDKTNDNENYPVGYTPDMLLPQEQAVAYGENTVGAKKNQGLTVEFTTTAETVAGEYTGTFSLVADGQSYAIPVTLQVYDITLDGVNGMTCMCTGNGVYSMTGEYDTTSAMYETYFETSMNEYKFMLEYVPNSLNPVAMADTVVKYWDNPNFTSYNIPTRTYSSGDMDLANTIMPGELYEYFRALMVKSTSDMLLLDKAYIYLKFLDEVKPARYKYVGEAVDDVYEIADKVYDDLVKDGFFDEHSEEERLAFEKSIKNVPILLTADITQVDSLGSNVNSYCVRIDGVHTSVNRDVYDEVEKTNSERGGETWFYTCEQPRYPMPTHHIDDALLPSRVMRWMQMDYGWEGYLYWATFSYTLWTGSQTVVVDPYEDPQRFPGVNGDGYLAYPGKKYGVNSFLPSLRLTTFRDGQEDYDLLRYFENLLREKANAYGAEQVDASLYLQDFYDKLYLGTVCTLEDCGVFESVRKDLFELITKHQSPTKFLLTSKTEGKTAQSEIYLADGYALELNGEAQTGVACTGGTRYTLVQDLNENAKISIQILKDGKVVESHVFTVGNKTEQIALNETTNALYVSETSEISYQDGNANVTLKSYGEAGSKDILFLNPTVGISASALGDAKLGDLEKIELDITNATDETFTVSIRFKVSASSYKLISYELQAGETKRICIDKLYAYKEEFSRLNQATFEIYTDNVFADEQGNYVKYPDRKLILSNVYYTYKGE